MFEYSDPVGTGALQKAGALLAYRSIIHSIYRQFGRRPSSGFTVPEAFEEIVDKAKIVKETVSWLAFPKSQTGTAAQIDSDRFRRQDEYVEWRVERRDNQIERVVFTTEFPEYYEALAATSVAALKEEVRAMTGAASVSDQDLFGPGFNPAGATPEGRAARLVQHARENPFNNGSRGIVFLTHPSSTLRALFNLVTECAVPKTALPTNAVCGNVSGACAPARNSDPTVCDRCQQLVRAGLGFTLEDPPGVTILKLQGIWKFMGQQIDINDLAVNQGHWRIDRNGRRAILNVQPDLTIGDDVITSGTQVSTKLVVGSTVLAAPENILPAWAKLGQESSRMLSD